MPDSSFDSVALLLMRSVRGLWKNAQRIRASASRLRRLEGGRGSVAYLIIAYIILGGLFRTNQVTTNKLGLRPA
jgi:hypothetical protein